MSVGLINEEAWESRYRLPNSLYLVIPFLFSNLSILQS